MRGTGALSGSAPMPHILFRFNERQPSLLYAMRQHFYASTSNTILRRLFQSRQVIAQVQTVFVSQ
jgi:hypothetical protein